MPPAAVFLVGLQSDGIIDPASSEDWRTQRYGPRRAPTQEEISLATNLEGVSGYRTCSAMNDEGIMELIEAVIAEVDHLRSTAPLVSSGT